MKTLEALKKIQKRLKLSDTQVASKLQITKVYWNYIKNGKFKPTARFLIKAIQAFPELQGIFLSFDLKRVK